MTGCALRGGADSCTSTGRVPRQVRRRLVQVAPRAAARADVEGRRRSLPAALLCDRAARREDAAGQRLRRARAGSREWRPACRDPCAGPAAVCSAASPSCRDAGAGRRRASAGPSSISSPAYSTPTRSHIFAMTARLWLMNSSEVSSCCAQPGDQVEHLGLDRRVQRRRRLVQDQQLRLGRERHRDHDSLRHAAGQLVRVPLHDPAGVGDLDLAQHCLGSLERLRPAEPGKLVDLGDLPADPDRRVQRLAWLLVDHGHRTGPQLAQLGRVHRQRIAPGNPDGARAHPAVARQVPGQRERYRGLARAGLTD